MAATTLIPVSEYLVSSYEGDRDYIDGEVRERNIGVRPHSDMLGVLTGIIHARRKEWAVLAAPSVRVRTSENRILVPDVTIILRGAPIEDIISTPPLAICEVLSPLDRFLDLRFRVEEYARMGVEHIWLMTRSAATPGSRLRMAHTPAW